MLHVDILNRRFGEALGRPNGNDPRFKWMYSPDVEYFYRRDYAAEFEKRCWADRIGKVWMLCQWRRPEITLHGVTCEVTREQWWQMFQGQRPYPAKGEYKPHPETALPPGMLPNEELTAGYIVTLREQMERSELAQKAEFAGRKDLTNEQCERDAQAVLDEHEKRFYDDIADWEPASWKAGNPHMPGDQDGPVAFQAGVGESPALANQV